MQFSLSPGMEPAEPTSPEEAVMVAMVRVIRLMKQRMPGDEIDFSAMPLLRVLQHNGPMRVSALAAALDLDASTVSRHAKGLEERGLLERTDDPDDGRASRVGVSALGAESLEKGAAVRRATIADAIAHWPTEDRETLRVLLHRLAVDLTADSTHAPSMEHQ